MYIKVFVTPGAKREKVEAADPDRGGKKGDALVISVREPARGNRANRRVREIVAAKVGKPVGKVRILTGHHSRVKMMSVIS